MGSPPTCKDKTHRHVVAVRNANYSAFNGYHRTPSDYSEIWCVETKSRWRAKGAYVDSLPDASPNDRLVIGLR